MNVRTSTILLNPTHKFWTRLYKPSNVVKEKLDMDIGLSKEHVLLKKIVMIYSSYQ